MRIKRVITGSVGMFLSVLLVLGMTVLFYPVWQSVFAVAPPAEAGPVEEAEPRQVGEPERIFLQAVCVMEPGQRRIARIVVELVNAPAGTIYSMELPVDAQIALPQGLYHELQVYAPTLPQYLKLSKMAESFSEEYEMEACCKILSDTLGVTISHWCRTDRGAYEAWQQTQEQRNGERFFSGYAEWLAGSDTDRTAAERWICYEAYRSCRRAETEQVPGEEAAGIFTIWKSAAKSRLEEWQRKP